VIQQSTLKEVSLFVEHWINL